MKNFKACRFKKTKPLGLYGKEVLSKQNKKRADEYALKMFDEVQEIRDEGIMTVRGIMNELNNHKTPTFTQNGR